MLALIVLVSGTIAASISTAADAATAPPPSLPGPPPGAGVGYPPAPAPGVGLPFEPVGPPAAIPATVSGPGLLGGNPRIRGRVVTVALACRGDGTASLSVPAIQAKPLARGRYKCQNGRAMLSLKLPAAYARRFGSPVIGTLTLGAGRSAERFSVTLAARPVGSAFWSDGGLQCNLFGTDQPYLVAPNFRVTPAATIDVRPWVAFYTATGGWRWLGTAGLNNSNWYQWSAGPSGVSSWLTPTGALNPWTWAPLSVRPGHGTYAIGVFEVEYLYFHPSYAWAYARSEGESGPLTTYCSFP
jgi:hypothetical protein